MRLLAIETSTIACSAALSLDGEILERHEVAPRRHADLLLPMIESLLGERGLSPADLDAVAFARGPGAFTGLRIAAGAAQGIAYGAGLPVVPVSTLAALAQGVPGAGKARRVLAAMDARMGEVYWGAYESDADGIARLLDVERVCAPDRVPLPQDADWFGAGDGWSAYGDVLRARMGGRLDGFDASLWPRARDVAFLAARALAAGAAVPAAQALPVYLRDRVAEKKLTPRRR